MHIHSTTADEPARLLLPGRRNLGSTTPGCAAGLIAVDLNGQAAPAADRISLVVYLSPSLPALFPAISTSSKKRGLYTIVP